MNISSPGVRRPRFRGAARSWLPQCGPAHSNGSAASESCSGAAGNLIEAAYDRSLLLRQQQCCGTRGVIVADSRTQRFTAQHLPWTSHGEIFSLYRTNTTLQHDMFKSFCLHPWIPLNSSTVVPNSSEDLCFWRKFRPTWPFSFYSTHTWFEDHSREIPP